MNRLTFTLRQALFGAVITASIVFGSAQAFATPQAKVDIGITCNPNNTDPMDPHDLDFCGSACYQAGYRSGSCTLKGYCDCWRLRPTG